MTAIDTSFDVYSDIPKEKQDPDSHSPTLRKYHQILWSKCLPCGTKFELKPGPENELYYTSALNDEFCLSSDSITHTYKGWKKNKKVPRIIKEIDPEKISSFFSTCSTIGAYIIFPKRIINKTTVIDKKTINQERGLNSEIEDRFDLTLECIRRFYSKEEGKNPLRGVLERYSKFFCLFKDFRGYVDFFLLQDLVENDYSDIKFWINSKNFGTASFTPLPETKEEYLCYRSKVIDFVQARNKRIDDYQKIPCKCIN